MKVGILYNCQHESLRIALGALLPQAQLISFDLTVTGRDPGAWPQVAAVLGGCDHIVTINVASDYGPLATTALRAAGKRVHLVPSLQFAGFHPDTIDLRLDDTFITGPTGTSQSRIAVAAFLAGLTPRETAALFNRLSFARLGYLQWFADQKILLLERYENYGIDLREAFTRWLAPGCFMHDANHPRMRVMLDLARAACGMAGLEPVDPAPDEAALPDPLADFAIHPVFPDIADAIGIPPSGAFRPAQVPGTRARVLGTEAFVRASHAAFARVPLAALRGGDGVMRAMAALNLVEAPRPRPAPRPPAETETAFLTWHGTVLGIETTSAMLVQRPFLPDDPDSTDMLADLPVLPLGETATTPQMGGATIAPGDADGSVTFSRGGQFLSALPEKYGAKFDRAAASAWERFWPVRASDLANWRAIAAGDWLIEGERARVPAGSIRPVAGFKLAIGDILVDLRRDTAVPQERASGNAAWRLMVGGKPVTLVQDRHAARRDEAALDPHAPMRRPGEVATPEEFRVSRDAVLKLPAPAELLHPPLTCCDADRAWLHKAYFDTAGAHFHRPTVGPQELGAMLVRRSNMALMLGRSVEGVLLDGGRIAKDAGFLVSPAVMPASLRPAGKLRLLDRAAVAEAPVVDGPVCVFYNPNLQNYYHWVAEALLSLHVMAPWLPRFTRLVLPGTLADLRRTGAGGFDHARWLTALGFAQLPTLEIAAPLVRLRDAIWIDSDSVFGMPASQVQGFRQRAMAMRPKQAGEKKPARRRLYVKRIASRLVGNAAAVEGFLQQRGFETVVLENMPGAEQIDLFASAEFVVAVHGAAMANILFCQKGTKILELTPDCNFHPYFWLFAEKLGLPYGVLPCRTADGGFNAPLRVNPAKFRALFRMLSAAEA